MEISRRRPRRLSAQVIHSVTRSIRLLLHSPQKEDVWTEFAGASPPRNHLKFADLARGTRPAGKLDVTRVPHCRTFLQLRHNVSRVGTIHELRIPVLRRSEVRVSTWVGAAADSRLRVCGLDDRKSVSLCQQSSEG
jgi:hypothetical protein